jgi:serine protease Do
MEMEKDKKKKEDNEINKNRDMIFMGGGLPACERESIYFDREPPVEEVKEKSNKLLGLILLASAGVLLLALLFIICIGASGSDTVEVSENIDAVENVEDSFDDEPVFLDNLKGKGELSASEIYERCKDSVVSISARAGEVSGIGSGFIYDENGYIATANHVIENMEEIYVIFSDGSKAEAQVISGNSFTDIALLKVDRRGLKKVEKGDSGALLVGERVVAIGTPASLDYAGSASVGEISYLDRIVKIYDSESGALQKKMRLIQTTAPLNPGNSGCPVFDNEGKVVGMVTMKLGSDFSGIGFAIPSGAVFDILSAMKQGRELDRGLLLEVGSESASLGISIEKDESCGGFKICGFLTELCDAALKLREGDIILSVGGFTIDSEADMSKALEVYSPNEKVTVTVKRGGQMLSFEVKLF